MAKKKGDSVILEFKLAEVDDNAYRSQHVDVALSALQGDALKRVQWALQSDGIRLKSGRFVQNSADAVRYILERIGEEAGLGAPKPAPPA